MGTHSISWVRLLITAAQLQENSFKHQGAHSCKASAWDELKIMGTAGTISWRTSSISVLQVAQSVRSLVPDRVSRFRCQAL
ncbi:hypothetical protein BDN72DRAFT_301111 [Pluteus cervinus]|uniref:Uncharacterized protein n=1 Tax=Pluteus cervinus TaxID=181527 RepID=A0ACD3AE07_9AGAR|nr:hypothetical protein BDN72DRAFT_301111 [Pluteus cervinus]